MASGTFIGSTSDGAYLHCDWQVLSQNIENNTSTVRASFVLVLTHVPVNDTIYYINMSCGGVSKTEAVKANANTFLTELLVGQITASVSHNADGSGQALITGSHSSAGGTGSLRGWATLPTIARQATLLTAPNFNDEENPTITYNNPLGEDATSLSAAISLDGTNPDIEYRDIVKNGTEYTFNLTEDERNLLRAATTGSNTRKVLFYVRTVIGESFYFSYKEATFTVINAEPTVEASVIDTNAATVALTGDNKTLIRYNSTAYAAMAATAKKLAEIRTYNIEHNGGRTSGQTLTVENVNGNTFAFIVSDNRGNTATETIVAPMIDYIRPTANIDTEQKMNAAGEYLVKCAGNYFNDTFGYTNAASANSITVQYRYKIQGGSYGSWQSMATTVSENTYTAQAQGTGFDYRQTYTFQCRIIDKLNTVLSAEITVKSMPIFHWSGDDFTFEVPVNFNAGATGIEGGSGSIDNINGDLTITGNLRMNGSGNYGNTIYFGDSSYAYITETTDDDITIKATDINLQGNVYVNGSAIGDSGGASTEYGEWTPTLAASNYISSYSIQRGWYQKVGNVVSIGWMIKATTASGGIGTSIKINGCPYTPSVSAFGGGIAHNVYISGGFTFTGWTIDDTGVISARGQACNNTGAANHEITSTVCYATSGNLMTLSGTICFMV